MTEQPNENSVTLHFTKRAEFEHSGTNLAVDRGKEETTISKRVRVGDASLSKPYTLTIPNNLLPALAQALQGVLK